MVFAQSLLFLLFGGGLLLYVAHSLQTGMLPCGSSGFRRRLEFHRGESPVGYWVMFVVYGGAGLWMLLFAFALLFGWAEPLPLR